MIWWELVFHIKVRSAQERRLRVLAPHQVAFLAYIDSLIAGLA